MEEKSMRGRALRPPTSASLSSDSLYDFMAAQLVEVLSLSWGLGLAGSGVWRGDAARGCALPGRKLISSSPLPGGRRPEREREHGERRGRRIGWGRGG
ncbi:Os01g0232625 [Oryza sativa Japonica Group]|jgi:hypothetical protein|uniref:Os01g0232625 protein n=1 Tax=Oryza sativa subsp. japonica TaxID=39947 RepID=A0A0P0V004_ORYSJ|nr:Os01g0232625 [Oryza sativa Japonica Group]